ncbi:hypothetical protein DOTSEDRAFT_73895 [Dothistroma septosporum NZE10]|uniref:Uncharacterized protein n=1 Tax=Dothistroma septosporum (strain NZE10 / CBS 128990) TaxID=675120 RepID=N1PJC2_DOTSN|nr:hypothetical protein DOTSEDRAFT_73895 [Dothistroma septosporum NZE10]
MMTEKCSHRIRISTLVLPHNANTLLGKAVRFSSCSSGHLRSLRSLRLCRQCRLPIPSWTTGTLLYSSTTTHRMAATNNNARTSTTRSCRATPSNFTAINPDPK